MGKKVILVFIDALSSRYLHPEACPNLAALSADNGAQIQTVFGFLGLGGAIYAGAGPNMTGLFNQYVLAEDYNKTPLPYWLLRLTELIPDERVCWYSRKILSWRISNTLEPDFCVDALKEALSRYGRPEIFNTDQGAQFTSNGFVNVLKDNQIAISMDGRGRCQDNIFVERLWWTIKHQYLYLHSFDSGSALRKGLNTWIGFYNHSRAHSSLDDRTPDEVYYGLPHPLAEAA